MHPQINCVPKFTASLYDHIALVSQSRWELATIKSKTDEKLFQSIFDQCNPLQQRCILSNRNTLTSWLTAIPIQRVHFDSSSQECRDTLYLLFRKPLLELSSVCDGCGDIFTTSHALDFHSGGLVIQCHIEIQDFCDLSSFVWGQALKCLLLKLVKQITTLEMTLGSVAHGNLNPWHFLALEY